MKTRYKPALCDGTPCAGDFSFRYDLRLATPHNFLADWHPVFWMVAACAEGGPRYATVGHGVHGNPSPAKVSRLSRPPRCGRSSARRESLADWDAFASSWDHLELDTHLPDGHRYRRRRHATLWPRAREKARFASRRTSPTTRASTTTRWSAASRAGSSRSPGCPRRRRRSARSCVLPAPFGGLRRDADWHIEVPPVPHRARAAGRRPAHARGRASRRRRLRAGDAGERAQHRERHDHDARRGGQRLGSFTLTEPLDAALVDDARVRHGVTAVRPIDPSRPAHRDVLVVTFRAQKKGPLAGGLRSALTSRLNDVATRCVDRGQLTVCVIGPATPRPELPE